MKRAEVVTAQTEAARERETEGHNKQQEIEENARIAIERAKNAREQQIYEQTYGPGANQALVGVEPKLRLAPTEAAQKAARAWRWWRARRRGVLLKEAHDQINNAEQDRRVHEQ